MAYHKTVKGQYNNQIKVMAILLLGLMLIALYWINFGKENYVKTELVEVTIQTIDVEKATGYVEKWGEREGVTVDLAGGDLMYSPAKLKFREGARIKVYKSSKGYTLYEPNTRKYDEKYYSSNLDSLGK